MQDVIVRLHDHNDDLPSADLAFINEYRGTCPDCRQGELKGGPRGGLDQNFRCELCGAEFKLTLYPDSPEFVIGGHRLHRDDADAYQLATLKSRWGKLDDSPPPGISREQWKRLEAEAAEAMRRMIPDRE